jgi:superfamily II DNA or RNA helicase
MTRRLTPLGTPPGEVVSDSRVSLRPYQADSIKHIREAYRQGLRRVLVSLPTGTGKTVVFSHFPRGLRMRKKLLILAHRDELLEQASAKLSAAAPEVPVAIEQGQRHADPAARVVIASVPTLGRAQSKRLAALDPDDFSIIVVDEAHHAVAPTYRRIFDHFRLFDEGERLLVGFTATPRRGDGLALGQIFQDIVYSRGIEEMIREEWLSPIIGWRVTTDIDLDTVRVRHGDFVEAQLARAVNVRRRNDAVLGAYSKYASGRRALVFCANVAHAQSMAKTFESAGIRALAVWGAMPRDERRAALDALRSGRVAVLTNCNLLTEGFDEPSLDCIVMARPTKSRLLYAQMIGRGTRLHPGKENLAIIDMADNSRAHKLAGLHDVLDMPEAIDLEGRDALALADSIRRIGNHWPWIDLERLRSASDVHLVEEAAQGVRSARHLLGERIRFFSFEPPREIRVFTSLAWHSATGGDYALEIGAERLLATRTILGDWWLFATTSGQQRKLGAFPSSESAIRFADRWVREERPESIKLASMDASWRYQPATQKQLDAIATMRAPVPPNLTRGQASFVIAHRQGGSKMS